MNTNKPSRILQISDFHLFADVNAEFLKVKTYVTLQEIIKTVTKNIEKSIPELLLLTGDLSQDYTPKSYENLINTFSKIPCRMAAILGNHDNRSLFNHALSHSNIEYQTKKIILGNWKLLLLNSYWPGHVAGFLNDEELQFLVSELKENTDQHIMIFLHHHVLPIHSAWLDKLMVKNSEKFLEIIDNNDKIKAVVCGHIHQESNQILNGIPFISTPATAWQFAVRSDNFRLDDSMPGYRWFDLYENGEFETKVVRSAYREDFVPDLTSPGY